MERMGLRRMAAVRAKAVGVRTAGTPPYGDGGLANSGAPIEGQGAAAGMGVAPHGDGGSSPQGGAGAGRPTPWMAITETVPGPASNVDCAYALALPQPATRVVEPSRFYSLTLADPASHVAIALTSPQTNSGTVGKLTRVSPAFEATADVPYLVGSLLFDSVPASTFCLEVSADPGIEYEVEVDYIDWQ